MRPSIVHSEDLGLALKDTFRSSLLPVLRTKKVGSEPNLERQPIKILEVYEGGEIANDYIIEPSAEELIANLIPTVLSQKLFTAAVDSNASEHAARTLAMQVATDNANELIQDLTKQYNKSRQQAITNELLDIVGGSMQ